MQAERIKALCQANKILWTRHCLARMFQRDISREDVKAVLLAGEIIEDYPSDHPYPSCLLLGAGPLHIVCGMAEDRLFVITAYRPDPNEWEPDYKTRKEGRP
ncbi:DUF4258 domain-containing protein [Acutalibacter caecimuris]|uniref:DUF4258 domain-containing protein n=1 Tax=Acutalibacter caecimuris TaxID=3093657 RepID=UPI002AC9341F|nr:DUF4258 domain-containing protein [Acutalibacter sp. M00118]